MNKKFAVSKKLCALFLSLLMIIGAIPISSAIDNDTDTPTGGSSQSTPDEAETPENPDDTPSVNEEYPSLTLNENAKSYEAESGITYYSGETIKSMLIKSRPDSQVCDAVRTDLDGNSKSNFKLSLTNNGSEADLRADSTFSLNDGILAADIDFTKSYSDGLRTGAYELKLTYKLEENEIELFKKSFTVINEAPIISNIKYNDNDSPQWTNGNVNISFEVKSEILKTVTVNGQLLSIKGSTFNYTASVSGEYKIEAVDYLENPSTVKTQSVLIDKKEPTISNPEFYDDSNNKITGWYNSPATVKVVISDSESKLDKTSIKIDGTPAKNIEEQKNEVTVSFKADEKKDYLIECKDNAGNPVNSKVKADEILLDTDAPADGDFTLTFEAAETPGEKVLNFLTFGLYSNNDIKVTVDVDNNNQSDISADSIMLYNGEEALEKVSGEGNVFILRAPENDGESKNFDLFVEAADEAGNKSEKFSIKDSGVKTRLPDNTIGTLKEYYGNLFEIVTPKVVPEFEQSSIGFTDFISKIEKDGDTFVKGNGKISIKAKESVAGISEITATLDGTAISDVVLTYADGKAFDNNTKAEELYASIDASKLTSGEHCVEFTAKSNSGMETAPFEVKFTVDNDAPELNNNTFTLSNKDGNKQKWTNQNVAVSFEIDDTAGIDKVSYYNSTEIKAPESSDLTEIKGENGRYSFEAESYGQYTVVVNDILGNKKEYNTEVVLIDKSAPEVVDEKFDYKKDWTNQPVTVEFSVEDLPENCSGIDKVTVGGAAVKKVAEGKYSFTADHYGEYTVTVTDIAGNSSKSYTVGPINFDDILPEIKEVNFSTAKNTKEYGIYNNEALTMTVTVENTLNSEQKGSELEKVEIRENGKLLASEFKSDDNGKYTLSYIVKPENNIRKFSFYAKDKAGNSIEKVLSDNGLLVTVDESAEDSKSLYEVVVTQQKPAISDIVFDGFNSATVQDKIFYNGSGTFKTTINDKLSGIDRYEAYFIKKSKVNFDDNGNITNLSSLNKVIEDSTNEKACIVSDVSNKEKIESVDVNLEIPNDKKHQSDEYTVIFAAYNLSGNLIVKYANIIMDNTPPEITSIDVGISEIEDKPGKYYGTVTKNGVYSSKQINVTVNFKKDCYSAGIQEVILYNGGKQIFSNTSEKGKIDVIEKDQDCCKYSTVFNLSKNGQYLLQAKVIDVFGNCIETPVEIKLKPITVNGKKLDRSKTDDPFEIVVNIPGEQGFTETTIDNFNFDFDYSADYNKNDELKNDELKICKSNENGKGNISITIENTLSGIKEINTTVTDVNGNQQDVKVTMSDKIDGSYSKKTETTVTVDASGLNSGEYKITIVATDMGGVEKSLEKTFYIDKTAPKIESIKFEDYQSPGDKLLNLLTFGLYSNDSVKVIVTVTDAEPSCGISPEGITLKSETGKSITAGDFSEKVKATATQEGKYTKSFILGVSEDEATSFYNDLSVTVKDNFDNEQTDNNYTDDQNNKYGEPVYESDDKEFIRDNEFDIVVTTLPPTVSDIKAEGSNEYTRADDTLWFSDNPTVSFMVEDNVSKIHSVQVYIDNANVKNLKEYNEKDKGIDITKYVDFKGAETVGYGVFTSFDNGSGSKINSLNPSIDTNQIKDLVSEGENTIRVFATGNNGKRSNETNRTFYLDTTKSVIQEFAFDGVGYSDIKGTPNNVNVKFTDYGFFFQNQTEVTVTANDDNGSGVNTIVFISTDLDGNKQIQEKPVNSDNKATFTVNANFKGNIEAYAFDYVNNNINGNDKYSPENTVVETQEQHDRNSGVDFSYPNTQYKDNKAQRLYPSDTSITFVADSRYAGIREIKYSAIAPNGNNGINGTISVNHSGKISDDNGTVDSFENYYDKSNRKTNLVTQIQKTVPINYNSNDIILTVTVVDRAGLSSTYKSEIISIDKTDPKIEVKYDVNNPNKVGGEDFYKTDRVATVTVTERNFNSDDFVPHMTHTDGTNPQLVAGTNWTSYTPDSTNPDSTVHIARFTFHQDSDYTFGCSFTDLAGRKAKDYGTDKFTVDQTAPKISVSYDLNNSNGYFNATRTATITIEEHNFYAPYVDIKQYATGPDNSTPATPPTVSGWTTSGNVSRATITFANDGKYSFTVDFKDKALNAAAQDKESEFYIDTKIDKIEIVDVEDMNAYDGTVAPVIHYFDNNYASSDYSLKRIDFGKQPETVTNIIPSESSGGGFSKVVAYSDFAKVEENDGIYMLSASIKDLAGNTDKTDILFSVNRFGSTFTILDDVTKELVTEKVYTNNSPDIIITEINVNEVTDPVIQINRNDSSKTLVSGTDYTVQESGGKTTWHEYNYKVLKKNFEDEGNYVVTVSSTDHFKNVVSNRTAYQETKEGEKIIDRSYPISFVVDKTDPIVVISGIDNDQYYEEAERAVTVTCDDANITAENLKIEFDGRVLAKDVDYQLTETAGSVEARLTLEADGNENDRSFKVSVTDKAGNGNKGGSVERFRLSASWFARLLHYQLPLVIIIGAAVAVLIVLSVIFIVRRRKKNGD